MMPETPKSSVRTAITKPNNVFYVWYAELCRRLNSNSAGLIRPPNPKCNTVLDFVADRLKFDDWSPFLNALRHDTSLHVINIRSRMNNCIFLHEVDTEDKARRMKRKYGALWTDFVLNSLVKSLSFSMKKTQVLTSLELDGLPMFNNYLEALLQALMENRTLKTFSLTNCAIQDSGCRSVCLCLQLLPNVEWLNLSRCDLSPVSGMFIAKLIKFQQLNRYTTSWHKSLRYSEPDSEKMCGIRRVTLNCNPKFGDEGLSHILYELEDDLWIKALDVQKCGITEEISDKILDILQYNRSLKIADFRQNEDLHPCTLEKIFDILREKDVQDGDSDFHWCNSVLSITPTSIAPSSRDMSSFKNKTFVLPPWNFTGKNANKSRTSMEVVQKTKNGYCDHAIPKNGLKKKIIEVKLMNNPLDIKNKKSQQSVNNIKTKAVENSNGVKKITNLRTNCPIKINHTNISRSIVKTFGKLQFSKNHKEAPNNTPADSPVRKPLLKHLNGIKVNGLINGLKKEDVPRSPSHIFQSLVSKEPEEEIPEDEASLLAHYEELGEERKFEKSDLSDSQISLLELMESIKGKDEAMSTNPKLVLSKYHHKGKKNGIK